MTHLGTIEGTGTLAAIGTAARTVGYRIAVFRGPDGLHHVSGTLFGAAGALQAAMRGGAAVLALEGGRTVSVIITSIDFDNDAAAVTVSGPVPGF